ncbi:hypothetical protein [Tunturiibacter gelidiferens]|uniref:hypothetical protein n=1 Tax=Tunturiibacter gelidiferens TaxID=3069689 RepID=UPI003D9B37EB
MMLLWVRGEVARHIKLDQPAVFEENVVVGEVDCLDEADEDALLVVLSQCGDDRVSQGHNVVVALAPAVDLDSLTLGAVSVLGGLAAAADEEVVDRWEDELVFGEDHRIDAADCERSDCLRPTKQAIKDEFNHWLLSS